MIPSGYIAGVRAGMKKTWWALSMPITSPLMPKITAEGSISLKSETVRASLAGSRAKPGASR